MESWGTLAATARIRVPSGDPGLVAASEEVNTAGQALSSYWRRGAVEDTEFQARRDRYRTAMDAFVDVSGRRIGMRTSTADPSHVSLTSLTEVCPRPPASERWSVRVGAGPGGGGARPVLEHSDSVVDASEVDEALGRHGAVGGRVLFEDGDGFPGSACLSQQV
ncbi:hypothetical protein GCM10009759_15620 [Kitasatospora saccharophila]|uniref:Uncharacterized protein n=2 Tax=Kitasatospora saccharophila TaxID=407973 RepID=A0ABN2WG07_9ACTN